MATADASSRLSRPAWKVGLALLQDALLVGVYALFFVASAADVADGNYFNVPLAVEQALLVGMFLTRRRSVATSTRPLDWLFACGAWLPLLLRSADPGGIQGFAGTAIQTIGLVMTCACFVALGRSFGLVAANRGLKTMGPYRLVRHPIYLSHLITQVGFCIANPTAINVGIVVVTSACQVMRIRAEERVLTETGDYATYRNQVRWRLLPGIF